MKSCELVLALDVDSKENAKKALLPLQENLNWVKIGMELFYSEGPSIIEFVHDMGFKVFLDLKLHDIPNTIVSSVKVLAKHNVEMLNCHIAGGSLMMKQAADAYKNACSKKSYFIGVTQLTSTDQKVLNQEIGIDMSMADCVLKYASLAKTSALDGVVCSAQDLSYCQSLFDSQFFALCPGIRLAKDAVNDQKRIMSPREAKNLGAKFLVVGRPILTAENPLQVLQEYQNEVL